MKLKVISYREEGNFHMCRDERGEELRVDLMVCGTLPEDTTPQSLVGKVVTCKYVHPFLVLAEGVALDSSNAGTEKRWWCCNAPYGEHDSTCKNAELPPVRSEPVVGQDELDALRKDKARLDWLETQACWIGVRGEYDITPDSAAGGGYSVTVRAVCDLAMSKAKIDRQAETRSLAE